MATVAPVVLGLADGAGEAGAAGLVAAGAEEAAATGLAGETPGEAADVAVAAGDA